MKRRTDRIIAVSAVTAVAVVPTAILMAVKTGVMSSKDSGALPPSAQMAQADPANPNNATSGAVAPSASGAPGSGTGTGGGAGAPGGRTAGPGGAAANPSPKPGPELRSFVRRTSVKLTIGTGGDYKQASETATISLWPSFSMNAVGVTHTMKDGTLSKITQKVIVSGSTLSGFDGEKWTKSKLSAAQLEKLRTGSDPRQFTYIIRGVPGNVVTGPDANGRTHYLAQALMGSVYGLLPKESADAVRKVVPDDVGISLDLWSGKQDRPATIGLSATAPDGTFAGSMTFGSYR